MMTRTARSAFTIFVFSLICAFAHAEDARAPEATTDERNERIRDRMRDYSAKLKADFALKVKEWGDSFLKKRSDNLPGTVDEIITLGEAIRKKNSLDATQLKSSESFKKVLSERIVKTLDGDGLKAELLAWAVKVELQTRIRLIECFQQIIAEDLGRSFDEKLKGKVVEAVKGIPIDLLIADKASAAQIETAILNAMPEAAISADARKQISTAAAMLARSSTMLAAEQNGLGHMGPVLAEAAGELARIGAEAELKKLNEEMTAKPDPKLIQDAFEAALVQWNKDNLQPRLEKILEKFGKEAETHVEDEARKINYSESK